MRFLSGFCILATLLAGLGSCSTSNSTIIWRPGNYKDIQDRAITVFRSDGGELSFEAGHHHLVERSDSLFIAGDGFIRHADGVTGSFVGEISEDQVDRIEYTRTRQALRFGAILLACCVVIPLAYFGLR
jgi:hypothetical protein